MSFVSGAAYALEITVTHTGTRKDTILLDPRPESCRQIAMKYPIVDNDDLARLRHIDLPGFHSVTLSMLFRPGTGGAGLERAMDELRARASDAVKAGHTILILSDRGVNDEWAPIPSLLATAGVHHHLVREGTRTKCALVVETGDEGPFVVDSGSGQLADKVIEAIRKLSNEPVQFIVNTSFLPDRTGGNVKLRASGQDPSLVGSFFSRQFKDAGVGATIIAQLNVETRMVEQKLPGPGWPTDTFLSDRRRKYHNGNAIEIFHEPNAITDGDSIVHFRQADVIVAGDIFNTTQFPFIDIKDGGSVQGEINALNDILNRTVFQHEGQGGTMIVPGHGYLSDEHEVAEYRDMMVIVRDRVRAMLKSGATLDQVKAARVTADYDTRYGANSGPWTMDMFVEAVYTSLKQPAK